MTPGMFGGRSLKAFVQSLAEAPQLIFEDIFVAAFVTPDLAVTIVFKENGVTVSVEAEHFLSLRNSLSMINKEDLEELVKETARREAQGN